MASAQNAFYLVCESQNAPYHMRGDKVVNSQHGWQINRAVGELAALLRNLLVDAEAGLLTFVADRARAEEFDFWIMLMRTLQTDEKMNLG